MIGKLKWLNLCSAFLQMLLICLLLSWFTSFKKDTVFPIYSGEYVSPGDSDTFVETDGNVLFVLLLCFTIVTFGFHLSYAMGLGNYHQMVLNGNNSYRWIEYTVTATLMLEAIALACGVAGLDAQILIAVTCAAAMPMGDLVEKASIRGDNTTAYIASGVGWLLIVSSFGVIARNFYRAASKGDEDGNRPPTFVYFVVGTMALAFASFGVIQLVQITRSKPDPILFEMVYSIDSMVSKTLLVGLLFGGLAGR